MKRFLPIITACILCVVANAQDIVTPDSITVPTDTIDIPIDTIDVPVDTIDVPISQRLPRIIIHNDSVLLRTFTTGQLTYLCDTDTLIQPIQLRHRGATSLKYDKPSLALKMVDSIGAKADVSFLGMRKDNYWILDAMACDKARMRNRASMDLWKKIAPPLWYQDQEPEAKNGYDGKMVEVWFDSVPMGVYCMMERIDRKQLKLKKYSAKNGIRGMLYKSVSWTNAVNFRITGTLPTDTMPEWEGWEISYPDYEDGDNISWAPLLGLADFISNRSASTFADSIADHIDVPTYINYCLLINLLSARDNDGKNNYWSFYDIQKSAKSTISLWDMDHSWGRMYNGAEEPIDNILPSNTLYKRFVNYYPSFVDSLESRYAALRTTYFSIEHLDSLLGSYFSLYAETGIDTLEEALWKGHNAITFDIQSEQEYIHNWLLQRLDFLDEYYHYSPIFTASPDIRSHHKNERNRVYDLYGRYISDRLYNLPNGLYIYRHDGIIEKIRINN